MKLILPSLSLLLLVLISGCVRQPDARFYSYHNELTGSATDMLLQNLLETPENTGDLVWLNASRVTGRFRQPEYYLEVRYESHPNKGRLEIPAGPSLTLDINGVPHPYRGPGSGGSRTVSPVGTLVETAVYPVSADELRKIAYAQSVQVKVNGQHDTVFREFQPENFENFREFIVRYVY
jgi:hypothetical protein